MNDAAFDIAASGMTAHRTEMDLIAANLANADTTQPAGSVFRARAPIFEAVGDDDPFSFAGILDDASAQSGDFAGEGGDAGIAGGVRLAGIVEEQAAPQYRYDPGNPLAITSGRNRGYVAMPDINPIEEMVELVGAGRAYDADVAALQAAKQMDVEAVDVDRS
jgi:flagellar basal-body rod protein FlgC